MQAVRSVLVLFAVGLTHVSHNVTQKYVPFGEYSLDQEMHESTNLVTADPL